METIEAVLIVFLLMAGLAITLIIIIGLLLLSVKLPLKITNPYAPILTLATLLSVFFAPSLLGHSLAPAILLLCAGEGWGLWSQRFIYGLYPFLATWIFLIISIYLLWGKNLRHIGFAGCTLRGCLLTFFPVTEGKRH